MRLLISMFFCSTFIYGQQNPIGKTFHGEKDGNYTRYYPNGEIFETYTILNGEINGTQSVYYENGKPLSRVNFSYGYFNGIQKFFNSKGSLTLYCVFRRDTLLDVKQYFYYSKKRFLAKSYFTADINNLKNINTIEFKEHKILDFTSFDIRKLSKIFPGTKIDSTFYFNRKPCTSEIYVNDKKEGTFFVYNRNGSFRSKRCYKNDSLIDCPDEQKK